MLTEREMGYCIRSIADMSLAYVGVCIKVGGRCQPKHHVVRGPRATMAMLGQFATSCECGTYRPNC